MDLAARPVDEACRLVALEHLSTAEAARARLGGDQEALHDFRVALRRLRSETRAYRVFVGRPKRELRRRLRRLVDATSEARDAEVQLAWIRAQALDESEQEGARLMMETLEARQEGGAQRLTRRLDKFDALARRLRKWLSWYQVDLSASALGFGAVTKALAVEHAQVLAASLAQLTSINQEQEAHRARILGKRLRYLAEPLKKDPRVERIVDQLKELQDTLGDLHDAHVAAGDLRAALVDAPLATHAGLSALARRAEERQALLFAQLKTRWLAGGVDALVEEVRGWQRS